MELSRVRTVRSAVVPGTDGWIGDVADARAVAPVGAERVACLRGDAVELVDRSGVVLRASLGPRPPSPYGGGPEWDGLRFAAGRLWYAGYDRDGQTRLALLDPRTLALVDAVPGPDGGWGDFGGRWFLPVEPTPDVGLFGNVGDDFEYVFLARDVGRIEVRTTPELRDGVADATDETIHHLAFLPGGDALVACDDLGFLAVVDLATGRHRVRHARPLVTEDEVARWAGGEAEWSSLRVDGVRADARAVYVAISAHDPEEFPDNLVAALDPVTLEPRAVAIVEGLSVELLPDGGVAAVDDDDETTFFRWS